jgi:hypothetical protein
MKKIREFSIGIAVLVILAVLMCLSGTPTKVLAASANQTNVTVQVASVTQMTVLPNVISWSSVNPGAIGGMTYIQIRNSGSVNITGISAYTDTLDTEPNNPYPAGTSSAFSSGSVLMIRQNVTGAGYNITDRLEWNVSRPAGTGTTNCGSAIAWGYYRNVSNEYIWCLNNATEINTTHGCNSTDTTFYIEQDADNGTADSRNPDLLASSDSLTQPDWGIFYFTSGPLANYCIATHQTCTKILIYKYDRRSPFSACTSKVAYLRNTTLTPGDEFTVNLDAWVPKGISAGWLASSWLTFESV